MRLQILARESTEKCDARIEDEQQKQEGESENSDAITGEWIEIGWVSSIHRAVIPDENADQVGQRANEECQPVRTEIVHVNWSGLQRSVILTKCLSDTAMSEERLSHTNVESVDESKEIFLHWKSTADLCTVKVSLASDPSTSLLLMYRISWQKQWCRGNFVRMDDMSVCVCVWDDVFQKPSHRCDCWMCGVEFVCLS